MGVNPQSQMSSKENLMLVGVFLLKKNVSFHWFQDLDNLTIAQLNLYHLYKITLSTNSV